MRFIVFIYCCLVFNSVKSAKYYWVGGSGNWSNLARWSASSGGSGNGFVQVPQSTDTVYFDANSFTGNAQVVTLDIDATCHTMNWTGATTTYSGPVNGPTFTGSKFLDLFGSIILASGLKSIPYSGTIRCLSNIAGNIIDCKGSVFSNTSGAVLINFIGTGEWAFKSDLTAIYKGVTISNGIIKFGSSKLNIGFLESNVTSIRTISLDSSYITFNRSSGAVVSLSASLNLTLNKGVSTLNFLSANNNHTEFISFSGGNKNFYKVIAADGVTFNLQSIASIDSLILNTHTTFYNNLVINSNLYLAPGKKYNITGKLTLASPSGSVLNANGTCEKLITISFSGVGEILGSGTDPIINYCILNNFKYSGVGSITANNSLLFGTSLGVVATPPIAKTLYWVGGSGKWHNGNNWSLSSGGAPAGCVPGPLDDAIFDDAGFSGINQTVSIDSAIAYAHSIDWSRLTPTSGVVKFSESGNISIRKTNELHIYGSLIFDANMQNNVNTLTYFHSSGVDSIVMAGKIFNHDVYFDATGTYNLKDNLYIKWSSIHEWHRGSGRLYINKGIFISNGFTVGLEGGFYSTSTTGTVNINLTNSTININKSISINQGQGYSIYFANNPSCVLNANGSHFVIDNIYDPHPTNSFYDLKGHSFHKITFKDEGLTVDFRGNGSVIDTLTLFGSAAFTQFSFSINKSLRLNPGRTYTIASTKSITFNPSAFVLTIGSCGGFIKLEGSGGTGNIIKATDSLGLNKFRLTNINASGGSSFRAFASLDNGGNSGFSFTAPTSRSLFWVGNGGSWDDPAHWSLSSGGVGGECEPTLVDDVTFDANSFTIPSQTLTAFVGTIECKNMDWSTVGNNPRFTSYDYTKGTFAGSLNLSPIMNFNYKGEAFFVGKNTGQMVNMAGHKFGNFVRFNPSSSGSYALTGDFKQDRSYEYFNNFYIESGTFYSNGYTLDIVNFSAASGTTVKLGTSKMYLLFKYAVLGGVFSVHNGANMDADSAEIYMNYTESYAYPGQFIGGGKYYNKLEFRNTSVAGSRNGVWDDGNTFNVLNFKANGFINGNTTILDSLNLKEGYLYEFTAGKTITYSDTCEIDITGTGANPIYLQSTVTGSRYTFHKNAGSLCADFNYIRDCNITGGAYFTGGANANNQANNDVCASVGIPGCWDFSPYDSLGSVELYTKNNCTFSDSLYFLVTGGLPKSVRVQRTLSTGLIDTLMYLIDGLNTSPGSNAGEVIFKVDLNGLGQNIPFITHFKILDYSLEKCPGGSAVSSSNLTASHINVGNVNGLYTGAYDKNWFNCGNWDNLAVPDSSVNVNILTSGDTVEVSSSASIVYGRTAACNNLNLANGTRLLFSNNNSKIKIFGNLTATGFIDTTQGRVVFNGAHKQTISGAKVYQATINNSDTVQLLSDFTVRDSLTFLNGLVDLNNNNIHLYTNGKLINETELSRVTDSDNSFGGFIESTGNFNSSFDNNLGNLGLIVNPTSGKSGVIVRRGHHNFLNGINQSIKRYFDVKNASSGLNATIKVSYFDAEINAANVGLESSFSIWKSTDLGVTWSLENGIPYAMPNYVERTSWGGFSFVTLSSTLVPLPIELIYFNAEMINETSVKTYWQTGSEIQNDYFTVQRSVDGLEFHDIGTVDGAGNSSYSINYHLFDNEISQYSQLNTLYYRLKQTDFDGSYSYSQIAVVNLSKSNLAFDSFNVYPNPTAGDNVNLTLVGEANSEVIIAIQDVLGKELYSKTFIAESNITVIQLSNGFSLASGVYTITASNKNNFVCKKVVVK